MQTETWKPVTGYEGLYEVSDQGNVRSFQRKKGLLKLMGDSYGYRQVHLSKNGKPVRYKVHRLVAALFLGLTSEMHVDHIDGTRSNNKVSNLRVCTLEENLRFTNVRKNKTSKFVGISVSKSGKWRAQIQVGKKKKWLGVFDTEEQAHTAYQTELKANSL